MFHALSAASRQMFPLTSYTTAIDMIKIYKYSLKIEKNATSYCR